MTGFGRKVSGTNNVASMIFDNGPAKEIIPLRFVPTGPVMNTAPGAANTIPASAARITESINI